MLMALLRLFLVPLECAACLCIYNVHEWFSPLSDLWHSPMQAVFSFVTMQLQLCAVFFTFSLGTRTHYFGRTILHGGAKVCLISFLHW